MKGMFVWTLYVLLLFVGTGCAHHSEGPGSEPIKTIKIRVVNAVTKKPIEGAMVFILEKGYGQPEHGVCRTSRAVNEYGLFIYRTRKAHGVSHFWIVAPGHKSISMYYNKEYKPYLLDVLGGSWGMSDGSAAAAALMLLPLIGRTEIRTDLENDITEVALISFEDDLEAWSLELNLGLFNLKNAVEGSAESALFRFIEHEKATIEKKKTLNEPE